MVFVTELEVTAEKPYQKENLHINDKWILWPSTGEKNAFIKSFWICKKLLDYVMGYLYRHQYSDW